MKHQISEDDSILKIPGETQRAEFGSFPLGFESLAEKRLAGTEDKAAVA